MTLPDSLQLLPAIAAAVERLGWSPDHPLLRGAAPTAARGHNLVVVAPPAPAYGGPALAGVLSRLGAGRRALLLAPAAQVHQWAALAHELARETGLRIEAALGAARAARRLRADDVDLLIASPDTALALHRRSALAPDRVAAVVLAWPEGWEESEALTALMPDLGKEVQRVLLVASAEAAADLVERYARRALVVGTSPADTPAPALAGPVRTASVAWERRAEALADLVELLDPASVGVWTADRARHGEIERAVGAGGPGVAVTTGDVPRSSLVVAFDPPPPERLTQLLGAGEVVLLMPPGTEAYLERVASPRRPLRLPGLLDAVTAAAGERRAAVTRAIEGGRPEAGLAALAPLFERYDAVAVAAALYDLWTAAGTPAPAAPPAAAPEAAGPAKIFVGIGKKDGATVNDLVAVLTKEIRVDRTKIGRVELRDAFALIELPAAEAERIASALNGVTIRRKRVTAKVDRGTAGPGRTSRPARPARPTRRT